MKVGDLVRYKHFPDETGLVINVRYFQPERVLEIDLMLPTGEIAVCLNPDSFEVINERG